MNQWPDDSDSEEVSVDDPTGLPTPVDDPTRPLTPEDEYLHVAGDHDLDEDDFEAFNKELVAQESDRDVQSHRRLVELYQGLDGVDASDSDGFGHFVEQALFNKELCPLCKEDVSSVMGGVTAHLEVCSKRTTPITDDIPVNPTAIIIYVQEQTKEMKKRMRDQAEKIKDLNAEIDQLKRQGSTADADKAAKEGELAELRAAMDALRQAKAELEGQLATCNKDLASARENLAKAIEESERRLKGLREQGSENRANEFEFTRLEMELEKLKKAKAEVEAQLESERGYVTDNIEYLNDVEESLKETLGLIEDCESRFNECEAKADRLEQEQRQLENDREAATKAFALMSTHMSSLLNKLALEVTPSELNNAFAGKKKLKAPEELKGAA